MSRSTPSPEIGELAQRLLAYEAAAANPSEANMPAVLRVFEKLRRTLSLFAGSSGFLSLLTRALTLAKAQMPGLGVAQVKPDGSLEGLSEIGNQDRDGRAGVILIAQLLMLLVTFVGEPLMRSLLLQTWPDFPALNNLKENDHDPTR